MKQNLSEVGSNRTLVAITSIMIAAVTLLALVAGCSQGEDEQFTAAKFELPTEVQLTMDSVNAFARSNGGAGAFEEFRAIYQHFLELYPNSVPLQMDLQTLYNNFGKRSEGQQLFRELYEANPDSAMYIYLYARTLVGPLVDSLYRKAMQVDSNYYWSNFAMASRIFSYPPYDTARAIQLYKRCIRIDNSYPAPFQQLAFLCKAQGNYEQAMKFADLFAQASQNPRTPLLLQAEIWEAQENLPAAEKLIHAYVVENPDDLAAKQALVTLYEKQDSLRKALAVQFDVARSTRSRIEPFIRLAELFGKLGDADSSLGYVLAAAQQGYDDYRRVENSEALALLKESEHYNDLISFLKQQSEGHTADRLASFADRADSIKQANLAEPVNEPLPAVSLTSMSGEPVSLDSLKGNPAVILFWSSWSNQSALVLNLVRDTEELLPEGVKVLAINMWDEEREDARKYLKDRGFNYDVVPVNDFTAEKFGVFGVPTILIADADGVVRFRNEGYQVALDQIILWQVESLH